MNKSLPRSCSHDGKSGYSFYVPASDYREFERLPGNTPILACELVAILQTLRWTQALTSKSVVIFSDSNQALQEISNKSSKIWSNIILDITEQINAISKENRSIEMVWIQSHVDLEFNEEADRLAKLATKSNQTEMENLEISSETSSTKKEIELFIDALCQKDWDANNHQLRKILPRISGKNPFSHKIRLVETKVSRLRLGKSELSTAHFSWTRPDPAKP